jgi:uncharacterized protein
LNTLLRLSDKLPLTCSRKGTCCHGNQVMLNPWELHRLAFEKQISAREFRDLYCDWNGILLKFNGEKDHRGKSACSQYIANFGCSLHDGRPLACRLFPIGRQIQNETIHYIFQGQTFPCLNGCPQVEDLPQVTVADYLIGQQTELFEHAQDAYLELMQNLAEIALMLLLDTGLDSTFDVYVRQEWQKSGSESPDLMAKRIGEEWLDYLILPTIQFDSKNPKSFIAAHELLLQEQAQFQIDKLTTKKEITEFSIQMMSMALFVGKCIGADINALSKMWSEVVE